MPQTYKIFSITIVSLILSFATANTALAGPIHQAISASTNMSVETGGANLTRNQSGLSVGYTSDTTDFDTYIASNPTHGSVGGTLLSTFSSNGRVDYDLGGSFLIDGFALWNFTSSNAVRDFTLFADDESSFTAAINIGSFTAANNLGVNLASLPNSFSFDATQASFIRLEILNTYGDDVAIQEVLFSTAQVPTPATIGLLLLGLFPLVMRRKKARAFIK